MIHPYNITVSPFAVLGKNVNMYKSSTIGVNTGNPKGAPVIGNCVQIGINATVIGGITIGDDVLIAPNAFVNENVPSHSVVVGNPCRIIPKENATSQFIWNKIWIIKLSFYKFKYIFVFFDTFFYNLIRDVID